MTVAWAFDAILAITVLAVAGWTIAARDTFAAVVGFVAYGLLLALVWVRLAAPDVALTEAAIGGGVTGVLLLGAAARLRGSGGDGGRRDARAALLRLVTGVRCARWSRRRSRPPCSCCPTPRLRSRRPPRRTSPTTGVGNPITGVLMAYRALDTLLEKVVLVLALIGVWSLAPDSLWGGAPGPQRPGRAGRRAGLPGAAAAARRDRDRRLPALGRRRTSPAAPSRAARSWPRCGSSP